MSFRSIQREASPLDRLRRPRRDPEAEIMEAVAETLSALGPTLS